jgi:hypothetical protein
MALAMSFMNTKNNRGTKTDLWGTPAFISSNSDNASLIATLCDLLVCFIPGLSTNHQLLEIYHTILTALDCKFLQVLLLLM